MLKQHCQEILSSSKHAMHCLRVDIEVLLLHIKQEHHNKTLHKRIIAAVKNMIFRVLIWFNFMLIFSLFFVFVLGIWVLLKEVHHEGYRLPFIIFAIADFIVLCIFFDPYNSNKRSK